MIELLGDPALFAERARPLLDAHLEANLLATVVDGIHAGRHGAAPALDPSELRDPPRPAAGRLRPPAAQETALVVGWGQAFAAEAGLGEDAEAAAAMARALIDDDRAYVWEHDGEPVSLVGHTVTVAGVPRVNSVFTPPELRRRGYAGSAVAALSARLFAAGARRVALFTDLANPTANRIYAELGYRRIADWEEHSFTS